MPSRAHRFAALDGLRFVAAFMVLLFHCMGELELPFVPRGYLAVDFFFALSGFVVAFAYEDRLNRGSYLIPFLRRRFVRLYPLCILAGVLGYLFHPEGDPTLRDMLRSFALIPRLQGWLFPVNIPMWSLFFEIVANIAYGTVLFRLRTRTLVVLFVAVSAYNLYYAIGLQSYDAGGYVDGWLFGFPRALQSFTAGLLIYRARDRNARLPALCLLPLTILLIGSTMIAPDGWFGGVWDWAIVTVVFPFVVVAGMAVDPGAALRRPLQLGGEASYPLYLVHFPLLVLLTPVLASPSTEIKLAAVAPVALLICAVAVGVYYAYDRPVRRWLTRLIEARTKAGRGQWPDDGTAASASRDGGRSPCPALALSTDEPR